MVAFDGATQRQEAFYGVSPRHCAKPRHRNGGWHPGLSDGGRWNREHSGTEVHFLPDAQIFGKVEFHYDILAKRMRELSFLNHGVRIRFTDVRSGKTEAFAFAGGVKGFVEYINKSKQVL